MKTYALLYGIIRTAPMAFTSHYRLYDENKNLVGEGDYVYTVKKLRRMIPSELKAKITTGIKQRELSAKHMERPCRLLTTCLDSKKTLEVEVKDFSKSTQEPKKVVEQVTARMEPEDNPRIYKVVLINGNYTIVKSESKYLTREQAKEELFARQLEDA